jgi:hypothetical protein
LKGAVVYFITKKILELRAAKNYPRSIIRLRVTNVGKQLTLSKSIEKLQHLEINFDRKNQRKKVILAILRCPLVAIVTGNLSLSMLLQRQWSSQHLCQV